MCTLGVAVNNILCWEGIAAAEENIACCVELRESFTEVMSMLFSDEEIEEVIKVVEINELVEKYTMTCGSRTTYINSIIQNIVSNRIIHIFYW